MFGKYLLIAAYLGFAASSLNVTSGPSADGVPRLDLASLESGYHGLVKENETLVEVTPRIKAIGAQICSFRIVNKHHGEAPFEIVLKPGGEAELRARKALNCEKRKNYKFDIAAVSCNGDVSDNATVHISVVDINEYAPTFLDPSYVCQVDEGRLYEEIVRVEATDRDCAIRNTEPLDYERSHNHILSVVAYDCGMKQSVPVMVTIKVNRICKLGWKGIPERIDYAPGTGREDLFPDAELELCDVPCTVHSVETKLNLATSHIGKGCDRDTYSVQSQRKLCEWTKSLPTDEGRESDQIFEFDGASSAVAIPSDVLDHNLASTFTIATWMKHKQHPDQDKHVCDNEWHHYAVSVKFPEVSLYVDGQLFKAEKKNPEIIDDWPLHPTKGINTTVTVGACWQGSDNKMKHHFRGYLAGLSVLLHKNEKPEVLSCLHKCKESLEVPAMELLEPGMELLTNSDLTELSIEGDNKTNLVILVRKIGYTNTRQFPTPGRRNLHLSTTVTCERGRPVKVPSVESYVMVLQPQQPSIDINGTGNVAREYEDFRLGVRVFTDVHITVGQVKGQKQWKHGEPVSVIEKQLDSCTVSVYPPLNPDHETVTLPENMLTQFGIVAKVNKDGVVVSGADVIYNYEQVLRQIQYTNRKPAYYLNRVFKLTCSELNGRFMSNEYVQTLTVIHPRLPANRNANVKPSSAPTSSSQHDDKKQAEPGHHIASEATQAQPAHAHLDRHHAELRPAQTINDVYMAASMDSSQAIAGGGSHAVTIIIVVCVGFLLFMIVLGVIRIRAAHHRAAQEEIADTEMAWDDSALTITVNPMEQLDGSAGQPGGRTGGGNHAGNGGATGADDDDSSDDGSSYRDDDLDSSDEEEEEEGAEGGKVKDLEWDNSTLAI
ncbi:Calsyntenin-1 [Blattella germanica]|nr:Calsyntenin-1 [Blattella germanica]